MNEDVEKEDITVEFPCICREKEKNNNVHYSKFKCQNCDCIEPILCDSNPWKSACDIVYKQKGSQVDMANAMCEGESTINAPHKQHFDSKQEALKDQIDKIVAMGDLPQSVISNIKTLYNREEYEKILNIIMKLDVHHRVKETKDISIDKDNSHLIFSRTWSLHKND